MGKDAYKHIEISDRRTIEHGLNEGLPLAEIARRTGFEVSSIRREIIRNRRNDGPSSSRNKDKNQCAYLKTCMIRGLCENGCTKRLCRACQYPCQTMCSEFQPRTCRTVEKAPFVCNACGRYAHCTITRYKYSAESADATARRRATESRAGIDLTEDEMSLLIEYVREGILKGQSIHHIFETYDLPVCERTFYRYVEEEKVPILSIELAKKVRYKKRKKKKAVHEGGFYAGHEWSDFLELPEEQRAIVTEGDTVLGPKRSSRCILSLHRKDLHFQIYMLLGSKTKEAVKDALDWLEICCGGPDVFAELFGIIVFDRGSEFDDIDGMERSYKNPFLKRCAVYFADPSRPDQKGAAEKNHVELRKLLPKGTSFDAMSPYELAEICSHVNSTIRKGCGNATPFALAKMVFPQELFDNLGLREIPPQDLVGAPNILYHS